jgi:hypothetical protein
MITRELATLLRDAGLRWHPAPGDAFSITNAELEGDVFTVSDMTIESHEFDTGTILGFNGTTEWALDSVAIEDALWLPREEQLRELLGDSFRRLERRQDAGYALTARIGSDERVFTSHDVACAYAEALVALIRSTQ